MQRGISRRSSGCLGPLGIGVLEVLRFIQDEHIPGPLGERFVLLVQEAVAGDEHVARSHGLDLAGAVLGSSKTVHVQRGSKARQLVFPVVADGGWRHHEAGAPRLLLQHHRDGLHGLAEAHVVGETRSHLEIGEPRQPGEAIELVIAQLGLQRGGDLRRVRTGRTDTRRQLAPMFVGLYFARAFDEIVHRHRGQAMQAAASGRFLGNALQAAKLALQILGQRDEPAAIERNETAARPIQPRQHLLHIDDNALIDLDLARHFEPVALLHELDGELLRADGSAYLERLALRPFEGYGAGVSLHLFEEFEHVFEGFDFAFAIAYPPGQHGRTSSHQRLHGLFLGIEIAVDPLPLAARGNQHRSAALPREVERPARAEGAHAQPDFQPVATPLQLHNRGGVAGRGGNVDVRQLRADRHGGIGLAKQRCNAVAHIARHGEPVFAKRRLQFDELLRQFHDPPARWRFHFQEHLRLGGTVGQIEIVAASRLFHHQFGRIGDQFDGLAAGGVVDVGVSGKCRQRRVFVEIVFAVVIPSLFLAHAAAHALVVFREIVEPRIALVQPLQRDGPASGPGVPLYRLLDNGDLAGRKIDQPGEALGLCRGLVRGALRLAGLEKLRQRVEGALPGLLEGNNLCKRDEVLAAKCRGTFAPGCVLAGGPAQNLRVNACENRHGLSKTMVFSLVIHNPFAHKGGIDKQRSQGNDSGGCLAAGRPLQHLRGHLLGLVIPSLREFEQRFDAAIRQQNMASPPSSPRR